MKFIDIIFCDDIRQELHNKLSLMGLYNDRMVLSVNKENEISWPQPINLSALLRFSLEDGNEAPNSFEFEYWLNKESILKINGELNLIINGKSQFQFQLILSGIGIPLKPGDLGFSIKLYSQKQLLLSKANETALIITLQQ
jgi:hypothetical protein